MKKQKTYQALAIFLAFLLLITSTGLTLDMHFCQGNLKSFSFLGKAKSCVELAQKSCHKGQKACHQVAAKNLDKSKACQKDCCEHQAVNVYLDTDLSISKISAFSPIQWSFLLSFVFTVERFSSFYHSFTPYQNLKPPLLTKDIRVFIQSFLF